MRSLLDITDFSVHELDELISCALDIIKAPDRYRAACQGKKLATLFFEPSTRTRLSFEAAMLELGGSVLSVPGASVSSATKGESVSDTAKVVSHYADIIALRHPKEGAALVAAANASVPLINAGDGGHSHPTQTLADLLTIYRVRGSFENMTVALCGDLKYGRTVHSLLYALSRYQNVRFLLVSPPELRLPSPIKSEFLDKNHIPYTEMLSLEEALPEADILYMTRVQRERFQDAAEYERLKDCYILTAEKMTQLKKDAAVLHPLPRLNEISVKVDDDPRACYFKQVENGKFMRMALILKLLKDADADPQNHTHIEGETSPAMCRNPHCILSGEQELLPLAKKSGGKARCTYCESFLEN